MSDGVIIMMVGLCVLIVNVVWNNVLYKKQEGLEKYERELRAFETELRNKDLETKIVTGWKK